MRGFNIEASLKPIWKKTGAITGEQYFTTQNPGFIWRGKTSLFTAIDKFVNDRGNLNVRLLSVYKMVDATGEKHDQGELLRWLGERAWFPTNLLPSENLRWEPLDNETAYLHYQYRNLRLQYKVRFNAVGELVSCETRRYMGEKSLENWIGKFRNYQEINGMLLPTKAEGAWIQNGEEKPYACFEVTQLQYDIPEIY